MSKKVILSVNKLCKTYSSGGVMQHVLKNLDLEVYEGDFTVIMGASGAGKSTLLYTLSGMDRPTLGEIRYESEDIAKMSEEGLTKFRRDHCGFVFQQIYMIDKMSVMDNTMVNGLLLSKDKRKVSRFANELFDRVNISVESRRKFPSQLSGGEQQRCAIVRGLINRPKLLFADEPTGALNSSNSTAVLDTLTQFNREGQSIMMVTHDMKSALRGNRVIYLKDGIICGTCELGAYEQQDEGRKKVLQSFLTEMGW